ncbi:MAG: SdpI family protein [Nanoarchaeota archaeon]
MRWVFVSIVLVVVSFVLSFFLFSLLPDPVASHWNAKGVVNGTMPRFWGAFFLPIVGAGLFLLLHFIPKIDPKKKNIALFRKEYDCFVAILFLFLLYIHVLTLAWNLGVQVDMLRSLMPAFAVLFFASGILIGHAKQNWFIGIRTPWTLESEEVWLKTHHLGSRLFKVVGILSLLGIIFPEIGIFLVVGSAILAAVITIIYSYVVFRKKSVRKVTRG